MNFIDIEQPAENIIDLETWLKEEVGSNTIRIDYLDYSFRKTGEDMNIEFDLKDTYKREYDKWLSNYNKHKE